MLYQSVLGAISDYPGIAVGELYDTFPGTARRAIQEIIKELMRSGAVERCGYALLRAVTPERFGPISQRSLYEASEFIQPPSLDRLMSGR
jgi:hypothetical protein